MLDGCLGAGCQVLFVWVSSSCYSLPKLHFKNGKRHQEQERGVGANQEIVGPQTIATFLFLEQHKKIYRSLKGIAEPEAAIV